VRVLAVERKVTLGGSLRRSGASEQDYRRRRAEYVRRSGSDAALAFHGELACV
jgi:hypothetical protein